MVAASRQRFSLFGGVSPRVFNGLLYGGDMAPDVKQAVADGNAGAATPLTDYDHRVTGSALGLPHEPATAEPQRPSCFQRVRYLLALWIGEDW